MKIKIEGKLPYIPTLAIGVKDDHGAAVLTMLCTEITFETKTRLEAIASLHVRMAENENEIVVYDSAGECLGILLNEGGLRELGSVAQLLIRLQSSTAIELRLFSMTDTEATHSRMVDGFLVFYDSPFLPELERRKAA